MSDFKDTDYDCQSKSGVVYTITERNKKILLDRYIVKDNGETELADYSNLRIGEEVNIRTLFNCINTDRTCYVCSGGRERLIVKPWLNKKR